MIDQLKSRLPLFGTSLSETVAWCTSGHLESDPEESAEIQERRKVGKEATKLVQRAFQSDRANFLKSTLYERAKGLYKKAKLHELTPLSNQLRSPILQPSCALFPSERSEQIQIVDDVVKRRVAQLRLEHRYPASSPGNLEGGRLLLYAPDENLFDGAAQYTSKGFFDVNNIPPWDTWVCFFENHLVSWVPPQLLELANRGIDVNPEGCILWAPETGFPNDRL